MTTDIIGGILAAAMYLAGWATGRRGSRKPPPEFCQCTHGSAFHDGGGCHATVHGQVLKYSSYENPIKWELTECPCVRYVGPLSSYVPELDSPKES